MISLRATILLSLFGIYQALSLFDPETEVQGPEVNSVDKRSFQSPYCQRCYYNPSDWVRCLSCYKSYNRSPFYGPVKRTPFPEEEGVDKRQFFDDDRDWAKRTFFDTNRDWSTRSFVSSNRDWNKRTFFDDNRDWDMTSPYGRGRGYTKRAFFDDNRDWAKRDDEEEEQDNGVEKRSRFMDCKCCLITGKSTCCKGCNYVPFYSAGHHYDKRVYAPAMHSSYFGEYCPCCQRGAFDFGCCLSCAMK